MFEDAHPLEVLRWAGTEFGDGLVVTASFGDAMLVHLVSQAIPGADVVLLDTGYLFAETGGSQSSSAGSASACARAPLADAMPDLWQTDPDGCCRGPQGGALPACAGRQGGMGDRGPPGGLTEARATTPIVHRTCCVA